MKTPVTRHEPFGVFPDLAPEKHDQSTAKSARNIRMNPTPPRGGQSRVRVDGNEEVPNSFLPDPETNVNWKVGGTKNDVTGQQYACNYNNNGDHAIYRFTEPDVWEVVIADSILNFKQGRDPEAADYVKDYVVNCLYHPSGLLLFQDGINEDRVINVERGIRTYRGETTDVYFTPIQDWVLAQLHRSPAFPPLLVANPSDSQSQISYVAGTIPKPIEDVTEREIQFGMNYGYMDGIESKIGDASICNWNNGAYLVVPPSETNLYLNDPGLGNPNPYIVYVKFYFRLGNTNEWNLFKKVLNNDDARIMISGYGQAFAILLPKMSELQNIGGISAAALSLVDGIGRSSKGTTYGDSRLLKWYIKSGYDITLPTAAVSVVYDNIPTLAQRKYRTFPPVKVKQSFAYACYDNRGRLIGCVDAGTFTITPDASSYYLLDIKDILDAGVPAADLNLLPWNQVADYLHDFSPFSQSIAYSRADLQLMPHVVFTPPTAAIDSRIDTIKLITKNHETVSGYLRTLAKPFLIFKGDTDYVFYLSADKENVILDGKNYSYYGVGFTFNSGEPINFSTEQNYYIEIRGQMYNSKDPGGVDFPNILPVNLPNAKSYKVTDQIGDTLVCKVPFSEVIPTTPPDGTIYAIVGDPIEFARFKPDVGPTPSKDDIIGGKPYYQQIWDIVLYSKQTTPPTNYNIVPGIAWDRAQFESGAERVYYGDAYICGDKKEYGYLPKTLIDQVLSNPGYFSENFPYWQGFWSSMNMNGIFEETWDSDIAGSVTLDTEPAEVTLTKGMIHGEQYLPGAKINNMFVFNPLNKSQVTGDIGDLIMIFILAAGSSTGDNIYCLCTAGEEIRYLSKIQQTASNGQQVMSLSTNVFGNENTQPWRVGIQSQLEAVNTGEGQLFYFDRVKKVSMQVTLGGQDPVSIQQFQVADMNTMNGPGVMGYDPFNNEFVYATADSGFAYNRVTKKYQGFRTFGVENKTESFSFGSSEGSGKNKVLYGWSKGVMYRYGATGNVQSINGESYSASLTIVSAPAVPLLKNFASVRYLSLAGKVWSAFVTNPLGRESDITIAEFDAFAGYFKGSIARDINSEGGKYDGDIINGSWLEVEVLDEDNSPKDLNMIEIGYTPSLEQ